MIHDLGYNTIAPAFLSPPLLSFIILLTSNCLVLELLKGSSEMISSDLDRYRPDT